VRVKTKFYCLKTRTTTSSCEKFSQFSRFVKGCEIIDQLRENGLLLGVIIYESLVGLCYMLFTGAIPLNETHRYVVKH
jgi:hypothetical protein